MATTLNLYEAKTHLSQLVERAASGEEIAIAKGGKPMARLVPLATVPPERRLDLLVGQVVEREDEDRVGAIVGGGVVSQRDVGIVDLVLRQNRLNLRLITFYCS